MSDMINQAFHFDSLVWDWPIAIYLFLAGLSSGAVILAILLKRYVIKGEAHENGIIRASAVLAPMGIVVGLAILVVHLTRPLDFWKIMIYYNPASVMSLGVMLFQIYMVVLFVWLAVVFNAPLGSLRQKLLGDKLAWVNRLLSSLQRAERLTENLLLLLALLLGVYTGFLLSSLKTYPLLNNAVLPALFLMSGLSSGAAGCLLLGVTWFKESVESASVRFIHYFERPVIVLELVLLVALFVGSVYGGGQKEVAAMAALSGGFWAGVFWYGVIGLGFLLPAVAARLTPHKVQHTVGYMSLIALCTLTSVMCLRIFVLYAGQMTVV